jgi:hypothetical protein
MQPFAYQSLVPSSCEIRLVRLLPDLFAEEIHCELFHHKLRFERKYGLYEALSYVWSDSSDTKSIAMENPDMPGYVYRDITHNLHAALKRLRDPDLPRVLWIDAICM